ncbi:hypothetical protein [Baaleninema sp.]|uniref:hypothetical protein n=1 Tax=Baaleninema sp. TaxID=3101197 RepID=UPI003D08DA30
MSSSSHQFSNSNDTVSAAIDPSTEARASESPNASEGLHRPTPPRKPEPPRPPAPPSPPKATSQPEADEPKPPERPAPIPAPSEPKQYRAIGVVRGRYLPSEEQVSRGEIATADGNVQAVLLGRVLSLVKNHIDLEQDHLWVVYPRTGQKDGQLHLQIVGVWEPETLHQEEDEDNSQLKPIPASEVEDGYFSIRGEVIFCSQERNCVVVKIRQAPRKPKQPPKFFKVQLTGCPEGKLLRHFWEFDVIRQGEDLVIRSGSDMGPMPPKRRSGGHRKGKGGSRKPFKRKGGGRPHGNSRPQKGGSDRPRRTVESPRKSGDSPSKS